jgi:hypothetical protein
MKKNYVVAVKSPKNWEVVHELLTQDGTLEDNIPTRACECTNIKPYSTTRSTYLLDNDEVELLKSNENIIAVYIDEYFHPEEAPPKPKHTLREVPAAPIVKNRFGDNVLNIRNPILNGSPYDIDDPTPGADNLNRTGYQLLRLVVKDDPWENAYTVSSFANYDNTQDYQTATIISNDIPYYDDGEGVDIIISDDGCWLAHPEFVENGISQVRDVVLDGPYYLDPAAFGVGGSFEGQTETYIGRVTCTEAAAKEWWADSSKRSTQELQAIGGVPIALEYTRQALNGSTSIPVKGYNNHGTACASQAYGKSLGWAFKANKWFIAWENVLGDSPHWDIINIFHTYKPNNETHGDKNPLVVSTSWGKGVSINTNVNITKYVNYRGSTSSFQLDDDMPSCVKSLNNYSTQGGTPQYSAQSTNNDPGLLAGNEVANLPRVFLFNASGNSNQTTTYPGHPDYDNWWSTSNVTPSDPGFYFNRIGYPGQIGPNVDSPNGYLTFSIGALMQSVKDHGGVKKEQRADYSNMGPGIDVYAPGNRSLAALNDPNELFLGSGIVGYFPIGRYDSPGSTDYLTLPNGGVGAFVNLVSENNAEGTGFFDETDLDAHDYWNYLPLTITDSNPPAGGSAFTVEIYIDSEFNKPKIKITDSGSGYSIGDVRTVTNAGGSGRNITFTITHLLAPYDNSFAGTSSACPVAAGFYACFLQRRRDWSALKLKRYIHDVLPEQDPTKFYLGVEATTANDASFNDFSSLQGGTARIPYILEPPSIAIDSQPQSAQVDEDTTVNFQVIATETTNPLVGTLSYQWEVSSDEGATWSNIPGEQSDTYSTTAQISNNNYRYRVMLSGTGGYDDTYSNVAILTINQQYSLNNAPTDIILSNISLDENTTAGSTVATISAVDADPGDTHVFFLIPGYGDNAKFYIEGDQLKILNNSDQASYNIKIETYDSGAAYPIAIGEDGYAIAKWAYTYQGATSMASPQVTGVLACLLEHYPRMSQQDCRDWIINNAKLGQIGGVTADKSNIDWTDQRSLFGAENRYLYYKKQRETQGYVTAQLTNNVRKSTGMMFPRKKYI